MTYTWSLPLSSAAARARDPPLRRQQSSKQHRREHRQPQLLQWGILCQLPVRRLLALLVELPLTEVDLGGPSCSCRFAQNNVPSVVIHVHVCV
jgi:hypothetical protein